MKPTILLVGKTGQIGSKLLNLLPEIGGLVAPDLCELDLNDPDSVRHLIRSTYPHLIVNAAAYTAVDAAENDAESAYRINAEGPALLAKEAARLNALLVHYSTDYVFDGSKGVPYTETDPTKPLNVYGRSKLAGEDAIRTSGASHLIFRTSWVYSTRSQNFLLTILRLATEREELRIVSDQKGAPTCADDIAEATTQILSAVCRQNDDQGCAAPLHDTFNMTAAGETTWYNFAKLILGAAPGISSDVPWFVTATRRQPLIAKRIVPISTEDFRSPARRPKYSVLSNARLRETFHLELPDWTTQLQRCLATGNSEVVPLTGPAAKPTFLSPAQRD